MAARVSRLLVGLALVAIFAFAAYWSTRAAWAESLARSDSRDDIARAIRLTPGDAEVHVRMAALLRREGADGRAELAQAADLKPDDYRIWLRLATECESRGDAACAERSLLHAASSSRQFEPRWRLANFYFRRQDPPEFWHWAREALPVVYADPAPLFRLCREMPGGDQELEKIMPQNPRLLGAYLKSLTADSEVARAESIARILLPLAGMADRPALLFYCDRSLAALRGEPALRTWNGLASRGLVPGLALDPDGADFVTNGRFAEEPLGSGFDWRILPQPGVTTTRGAAGLTIDFSGRQPEDCDVLMQWIPAGGRSRHLGVEYRTTGVPAASGFRFAVVDAASARELDGASLASDSWKRADLRFPARLARMVLSYRRAPGTMRLEGSLELRRVEGLNEP
jgi:hypothetical protein